MATLTAGYTVTADYTVTAAAPLAAPSVIPLTGQVVTHQLLTKAEAERLARLVRKRQRKTDPTARLARRASRTHHSIRSL